MEEKKTFTVQKQTFVIRRCCRTSWKYASNDADVEVTECDLSPKPLYTYCT